VACRPDCGGPLLAVVAVGIGRLALANLAWDQGLQRGHSQLLAVMAYAMPLVSALILIAAATINLLIGAVMTVGAGLLSTTERSEPGRR
jgi:drug/metabolite transporter (DMT)-like permease